MPDRKLCFLILRVLHAAIHIANLKRNNRPGSITAPSASSVLIRGPKTPPSYRATAHAPIAACG
jgi:hypothetical protein